MPITESDLTGLRDGNVVSASGDKIGSIGQIYLDDQTGEPSFVTANTGLFGTVTVLRALAGGAACRTGTSSWTTTRRRSRTRRGSTTTAPSSPEEEDRLYAYYGLGAPEPRPTVRHPTTGTTGADRHRPTACRLPTRHRRDR